MSHTPPVDSKGAAIDKALDSLELGFRKGSAWTQSNGEQSWEMPPPQIIFIKGKKKARQAILAILAQEVKRKRVKIACGWCKDVYTNHPDWMYCPWCGGNFEENEFRKAGLV